MPYDERDLRSELTAAPPPACAAGSCRSAQYFELAKLAPDDETALGTRTWMVRSQSCCVAFSLAQPGDGLSRADQPDEYMVLLPPGSDAVVTAGSEQQEVAGGSVVVLPAGASTVALTSPGVVVRVFSTRAADLTARCRNAAAYGEADPRVAEFQPWPEPPGEPRLRVYSLADHPPDPSRFGRILRCTTVMVNYFEPEDEPRDPSRLSPHHHDDFEQLSLQLDGDYVHHMRTPWTVNLDDWRDDEHQRCSSPALTIIPPGLVHTSQSVDRARHQLIDIFCPPRLDFSERPGWVRNAGDYPMPSR